MATEEPGSGSLKVSGARQTGKLIIRLDRATESYADKIPELGAEYAADASLPVSDLYFYDADLRPGVAGLDELILNYKWYKGGTVDTELRTGLIDAPITEHKDYLLRWDNYLVSTNPEKTDVPEWWYEASSLDDIKDQEDYKDNTYVLVTTINANKGVVVDNRIKKKNTYKKPTTIVTERSWFDRQEPAIGLSLGVGKLIRPANLYGRDNDSEKWMVTSSPVKRDGGYWLVTRTYEYNITKFTDSFDVEIESWDTDLYSIV